jgi:hypothetical protein
MPCTPSQVEKFRKYNAKPTTSFPISATSAYAAGCGPKRAARNCSGVALTSSGARS